MLIFNDNFYSIPIELNVREILKLSTDKLAVDICLLKQKMKNTYSYMSNS